MGPKRGSWLFVWRPRVKYPESAVFNAAYGKTERNGGLNVHAIDLIMNQAGFDLEGRTSAEKREHLLLYLTEVIDAMDSPPPSPPPPPRPPSPPSPITPSTPPPQMSKCWLCDLYVDDTGYGICAECQLTITPPPTPSDPFNELGCSPTRPV